MKKSILFIVLIVLFFLFLNKSEETKIIDTKVVAFISLSDVDDNTFAGFKEKMLEYGWKDGNNIKYIVPGAAKVVANLEPIIKSVIAKKPNLILVASTPATKAVKKENSGIPTVFCPVNDPVGSGIVSSSTMPKGDITGIRLPIGDLKRFEWLHKIAPKIKKVLVPYSPKDGSSIASRNDIYDTAKSLDIKLIEKPFLEDMSLKEFIKTIPKDIEAIFLPRDSRIEARIKDFAKYAIEKKLPLSAPSYQQVEKGALFTFGFIHTELGKDAAKMVDRLLKGVKPADLPVKFGNAHLVINEKTAKAIGIVFPEDAIRDAKLIIKD